MDRDVWGEGGLLEGLHCGCLMQMLFESNQTCIYIYIYRCARFSHAVIWFGNDV